MHPSPEFRRSRSRGSHDELRGKDLLPRRLPGFAILCRFDRVGPLVEQVHQAAHGALRHLPRRLTKCCQRRPAATGQRNVIEPHDADIAWHRVASLIRCHQAAHRHFVVREDDGGRRVGQSEYAQHRFTASPCAHGLDMLDDGRIGAQGRGCVVPKDRETVAHGKGHRRSSKRDAPMAQRHQMIDGELNALAVVDVDADGQFKGATVGESDHMPIEPTRVLGQDGRSVSRPVGRPDEDDAADAVVIERFGKAVHATLGLALG
jgi:hypothetical protein